MPPGDYPHGLTVCKLGEPTPHRFDDSGENPDRCRRCGWMAPDYWHNPTLSSDENPYQEGFGEIDWSAVPFS